jgi:surface antigen
MTHPAKLSTRAVAAALLAVGSLAAATGAAQAAPPASPAAPATPATTSAGAGAAAFARAEDGLDPGGYPWQHGDPGADDGHGYLQGSCASFAAWALRSDGLRHRADADHLGEAAGWRGAAVDGAPRVGDIAQWDPGAGGADGQGHVAYVAAVHRGTVTVFEYNWSDAYNDYRPNRLSIRTLPAADPSRYLRF